MFEAMFCLERVLPGQAPKDFSEKNVVFITPTPQMPPLTARLSPKAGLAGKAVWNLKITFVRKVPKKTPPKYNVNEKKNVSAPLPGNKVWNIDSLLSPEFYGGTAIVNCTYNGLKLPEVRFFIRGENPTQKNAVTAVGILAANYKRGTFSKLWYAAAIGKLESNFEQFNVGGRLGPSDATDVKAAPNRSRRGKGWGMYQLTNLPSDVSADHLPHTQDLWNWRRNASDGIHVMNIKWNLANTLLSHKRHIGALCDRPIVLDGYTFKCGTAKVPVDLVAIEAYNGLPTKRVVLKIRGKPPKVIHVARLAVKYSIVRRRWILNNFSPTTAYDRVVLPAYRQIGGQ